MTSRFVLPFADVGSGLSPSDGAKLTFKNPGLETLKDTFSDAAGTIANTNPVVSDATGLFSNIYINGNYDVVLQDKNNVQIWADSVSEFATTADATTVKNFATLALAVADTGLVNGDALNIKERTTGNGESAMWDVVLSSTVTENTKNIVQATGVGTLSLVQREVKGTVNAGDSPFNAVFDGVTDDTAAIQAALDSGASVVEMPVGETVTSSALTVPNFVSLFGQGVPTVNDTEGTTIIYTGTVEAITVTGSSPAVPFTNNKLANFRIRKKVQQSTRAAIAVISCGGVKLDNIRVDTDSNSYHFQFGVVVDECQLTTLTNLDIQGTTTVGNMTAGLYFANGDTYTAGNPTSSTNTNIVQNLNINTMDYGIVHEGGEGFTFLGGNINGCGQASMRIASLNSFSIDQMYAENNNGPATSMQAEILVAQTTLLNSIGTGSPISVGAGGNGTIKNCRMASQSTNCIQFSNFSIQTAGWMIYGNKFGSGRIEDAIATTLVDGLRDSWIGVNVNLADGTKRYIDADIYLNNTVLGLPSELQLEPNLSVNRGGKKNGITTATRVVTEPYIVVDSDQVLYLTNAAGAEMNVTLPTGAEYDGRILEVAHVSGNDPINVSTSVLNGEGATVTIKYDHTATKWRVMGSEQPHSNDTDLNNISAAINTKASKVDGFKVFNETTGLYVIASGNADGSVWVREGTGTTANTPV